jgi:hypothetical protein
LFLGGFFISDGCLPMLRAFVLICISCAMLGAFPALAQDKPPPPKPPDSKLQIITGGEKNVVPLHCSSATPNAFSFTNQANVTPSTLTASNIVQLSGFNWGFLPKPRKASFQSYDK